MAKFEKSKREIVDVDLEIEKLTKTKKETTKKVVKQTEKKQTPKKKETKNRKKKESKIINFFKEVKHEMSKVQFPGRKEMVKYSLATVIFILFFSILFYVVEIIIAALKAWV